MTAWLTVILLIVVGLTLINIEVIFIPGTTVVGLLGAVMATAGVVFSFIYFDNAIGFIVLGITVVITAGSVVYFFKNNTWKAFALHDTIKGRVNEGLTGALKVGEQGITTSSLRPVGKAEFWGQQYEVHTVGDYVDSNTKVTIVKIESNKILVEPLAEPIKS